MKQYIRNLTKEQRHKERVRGSLRRAVKRGLIDKPNKCEMIDQSCTTDIQAHHPSYDRPLDVQWLCTRHHSFVHKGEMKSPSVPDKGMNIKTYVRPKNVKTATKILRKGRGAWGDFVNGALEREALGIEVITKYEKGKPNLYSVDGGKTFLPGEEYKVK